MLKKYNARSLYEILIKKVNVPFMALKSFYDFEIKLFFSFTQIFIYRFFPV